MSPGIPELLIVLVIALLILGPKRLPALGRQLGGGMRNFKDAITRRHDSEDDDPELEQPAAAETETVDGEVVTERKA